MIEHVINNFRRVYQNKQAAASKPGWLTNLSFAPVVNILEKTFGIVLVLLVWELAPRLELIDPFLLPPFSEVIQSLFRMVVSGEIFRHFSISISRSFTGFFVGIGIAIPLGIFMGWYSKLEEVVDPLVQACRNSSVLALYPVFLLFFGLGEASKMAIIIWGTIWPSLLNTISGVKNTDPLLIKAARSMGVSRLTLLYKVIAPAALPSILTGVRLSAASSILVLVAAEMIGANAGLGFMIFYFEERYAVPEMYAGIITMSLLGVTINYLLVALEKRLTGWKEKFVGD
ncbi:ABC transporter permease [Sporomusa sp.]|jgi:NitT/TauT family transport system permease protein|uniref:ABC transporter permease n=1 Tax=Sporomusa sp. TaxID=2078658 RepID=UPI002BB1BB96|nr:ABC transporter permease [Sporomusa sp.]MDF2875744.1 ssuC 3 [Sporomusa sp.]HWR09136.1 ABC transporter permease [Sporomusa sp.]